MYNFFLNFFFFKWQFFDKFNVSKQLQGLEDRIVKDYHKIMSVLRDFLSSRMLPWTKFKNVKLVLKKNRVGEHQGVKKSQDAAWGLWYTGRKDYELDEKEEAGSQKTRESRPGYITWNYFNQTQLCLDREFLSFYL